MIIKSEKELQLLRQIQNPFLYPVLADNRLHDKANNIIAFVIIDIDTKDWYVVGNGHPDCSYRTTNIACLNQSFIWTYNKFAFKYAKLDNDSYYDIVANHYLKTNQTTYEEHNTLSNFYINKFPECFKVNEIIPIQKHVQFAWEVLKTYLCDKQEGLEFYNHTVLTVLHAVEYNGLKINAKKFEEVFGKTTSKIGDYAYTKYNPYTTTGRPSNRFGSINYAALTKDDDSRSCFESRNSDGLLLEIDFESYHPRLLASIVGYDFEAVNVYEHLAHQYFNTNTPTKEQIKESKELTFRQLYGGVQAQYRHTPFFAKVNEFANNLYRSYKENGFIASPISGRKLCGCFSGLDVVSKNIILNYFIQMYETEFNMMMLRDIFKQLSSKNLPVLYTYDSILFDTQEPHKVIQAVLSVVDESKFPFKIKTGYNYKELFFADKETYLLEKST